MRERGLPSEPSAPERGLPSEPSAPERGLPSEPSAPERGLPSEPSAPERGLPSEPSAPERGLPSEPSAPSGRRPVRDDRAREVSRMGGGTEPIEVRKIPLHSVADASELTALIDAGVLDADRIVAVIGKTEGNGGVNDYTRIIADRAFREVIAARGTRSRSRSRQVPIVWSGGTDGVLSPHATVFATLPVESGPGHRRTTADRRIRDERAAAPGGHRPDRDDRQGRGRGPRGPCSGPASPTRRTCTTCRPRPRC